MLTGTIESVTQWFEQQGPALVIGLLRIAVAAIVGLALSRILHMSARSLARRSDAKVSPESINHLKKPGLFLVPLLAVLTAMYDYRLPEPVGGSLVLLFRIAFIAATAWFVMGMWKVFETNLASHYRVDVEDNLEARRIHTQMAVLRRIVSFIVVVIAFAASLMLFPGVRQLGASLLASAGIAGLVVGMAARPALSNLIAGVQIALTQPIRLDDVVIIEGEWGRIEEITQTYVVVRIWDLRRLIVPLNYFLETPFQNWTRTSATILGTVYVYTDYTAAVDDIRSRLKTILEESRMWDGKTWGLQVTNATDKTMELRALMSAPDASKAWDLRCHVRERLIDYLQQRWPGALPKVRAQLEKDPQQDRTGPEPGDGIS